MPSLPCRCYVKPNAQTASGTSAAVNDALSAVPMLAKLPAASLSEKARERQIHIVAA